MLKIVPDCFAPELTREGIQISCAVQLSTWKGEGSMSVRVDSGREGLFLKQLTSAC